MIRDLYDNNISAYKAGTQQMVNLVLDIICLAMRKKKKGLRSNRLERLLASSSISIIYECIRLKTGVAQRKLRHSA